MYQRCQSLEVLPVKNPFANSPFSDPSPPTELAVVGENRDDPLVLLVVGTDLRYYAYSMQDGDTRRVEPDDRWDVQLASIQNPFT